MNRGFVGRFEFDFPRELNESRCVVHNGDMNDPEPIDPRRRIRELNAIPERDRTDEQWDELNELEIRTAPGNRESDRQPERSPEKRSGSPVHGRRPDRNQGPQGPKNNGPRPDARPDSRPPQEARVDGRPPKRQHRRPKRPPNESPGSGSTPGNGGGSGSGSSSGSDGASGSGSSSGSDGTSGSGST